MKSKASLLVLAAALAAAPLIMSGVASAASATPTPTPAPANAAFSDNYFSDAGSASLIDGTMRVVNNSGATEWALIYVTDKDQELKECCPCKVTNGGTLILSVNNDLTPNPANGVATTDGSIALISSSGSSDTKPVASGSLQAYSTHSQGNGWLTETAFSPLALSAAAKANLATECAAVQLVGSGAGICTCGTGG